MSNVRFYHSNRLAVSSVVLKNGTGGGAPALNEDTDFPMSNLKLADRNSYWRTSAIPGDPLQVDFQLAAGFQSVVALGITNLDLFDVYSQLQVLTASVYPAGPWTARGTIPMATVDNVTEIASVSAPYWRFEFSNGGVQFRCKLWLAATKIDMGKQSAPPEEEEMEQARSDLETPRGLIISTWHGTPRLRYRLPWPVASATLKNQIKTIAQRQSSLLYGSFENVWSEVIVDGARARWARTFDPGGAPRYETGLELVQLV